MYGLDSFRTTCCWGNSMQATDDNKTTVKKTTMNPQEKELTSTETPPVGSPQTFSNIFNALFIFHDFAIRNFLLVFFMDLGPSTQPPS